MDNVTVEVYTAQGAPASQEVCPVVNVSIGGMLFRAALRYEIDQFVRLTFAPPEGTVSIRTDARVAHWHVSAEGKFVGVQFGALGAPESASIAAYVERMQDN